jgi:hypothetical protein
LTAKIKPSTRPLWVCADFLGKDKKRRKIVKIQKTQFLENTNYTGCRKINVFQVGGLVGKNLRNLEKIK